MLSAAALLATACNGAGAGQRIAATPPSTSATLSLKSALIELPEPHEVTVACRGGTVCKELVAPREATEAIAEAKESCEERGGVVSAEACPRADIVGQCDLGGGAGPIRVFTYDQSSTKQVEDLCNTMDGTLTLR
jgi:hypothetical protein